MATSTELYINAELPKRIYTDQFPLTVGHVPVATGNGLEIVARQLDVADVANAASQQDITDAIDALIDNAPTALDTLNELAAALGDDANYATTVTTALGDRLRVDINTQGLTATEQQNGMDNLGVSEVITGASIDGSGVITFTKNGVAADDTVQVPTAVDGLSFNATTGEMTLSYTNGVADSTITVASNEVADNVFRVKDNTDGTKKIAFEASGITTATTRTVTVPDRNVDLGKLIEYITLTGGTSYTLPAGINAVLNFVDGAATTVNFDALDSTSNNCTITTSAGAPLVITKAGTMTWKDDKDLTVTSISVYYGETVLVQPIGSVLFFHKKSANLASSFKILSNNRVSAAAFNIAAISAATTRTISVPDRNVDLGDIGAIPDHVNGTVYTAGQVVNYLGQAFRCWSSHTSNTSAPDYDKFAPVSGILIIDNASGSAIVAPANPWIMEMVIISAVDFTINGNNSAFYTYPIRIVCAATASTKYITITSSTYTLSEEGSGEATIYLEKGEEAIIIDGVSWSKGKTNIKDFNTDKRYSKNDIILRDGTLLKVSSAHISDAVNFYPTTYNAITPLAIPGCKVSKDYLGQQLGWTANFLDASSTYSMVLFGNNNSIRNVGNGKAVLSGTANTIGYQTNNGLTTVASSGSLICGGQNNSVTIDTASEYASCLVGGYLNAVSGAGSFLGGGSGNKSSGDYNVVCGGQNNSTIRNGSLSGDRGGSYGFIGNGQTNSIVHGNTKQYSAILNGTSNSITGETYGTVLNGTLNGIGVGGDFGLVGNGNNNSVTGARSTVVNGNNNSVTGARSTVVNGSLNAASGAKATVLNGTSNTASGANSTIFNGSTNIASGAYSVVGSGTNNTASGVWSVVLNGGGGISWANVASGNYSTILNGKSNTASGQYSSVLAGSRNTAAGYGQLVLSGHDLVSIQTIGSIISGGGWTNNTTYDALRTTVASYKVAGRVDNAATRYVLADGSNDPTPNGATASTAIPGALSVPVDHAVNSCGIHDISFMILSDTGAPKPILAGQRRAMVYYDGTTYTLSGVQTIGTDHNVNSAASTLTIGLHNGFLTFAVANGEVAGIVTVNISVKSTYNNS